MLRISRSLNDRADQIATRLEPHIGNFSRHPPRRFEPDVPDQVHISAEEIVGDSIQSVYDTRGHEVGRSFRHEGGVVVLTGSGYQDAVKLAQKIHDSPDVFPVAGLPFVLDQVFEWLRARHLGACLPLIDTITDVLEREVKEFEVWLPVAQLYVEAELPFGEVTFKTVSKELLDSWEVEMLQQNPEPTNVQATSHFFADRRKAIQGLAAVTLKVRAEPSCAYEQALYKAEVHLAMLRCLSAICTSSRLSLSCVLLGAEDLSAFQYFLMAGGSVERFEQGQDGQSILVRCGEGGGVHVRSQRFGRRGLNDWVLDAREVRRLRATGWDRMSDFLRVQPKTPFQMDVMNALSHYSRAPLCRAAADKLNTILTALEAILSADKPVPQEVGERMAMLSGQSVDERKAAVDSLMGAYRMRGALVRNRPEDVDEARLEAFMMNAWVFFTNLVGVHGEEENLAAWLKRLDNWKLCGGLLKDKKASGDEPK